MHTQLFEGMSNEFELFPDINLYLKIKLKDKVLPGFMTFFYSQEKRKDLTIYTSREFIEPLEGQCE